MQTKKGFRYLRFSSDGQSNSSIERQDMITGEWSKFSNVVIADTFIDEGHTAKTFDRPDMNELMNFIKKNYRDMDYLIVSELTRFSRKLGDAVNLVEMIQKTYNIKIVSAGRNTIYDVTDSSSFFMMSLEFMLGNVENIKRENDINGGIYTAKAREGRYIGGHTPFGYTKEGENKERRLVPVEAEVKVICYIYESFLQGTPLNTIYKTARTMGLKARGNSIITGILKNPIYSGRQFVKHWKDMPGGLFPANIPPIIDVMMWNQVQKKFSPQKKGISQSDAIPLRGVLHCHCGKLLTGAPSINKLGNPYYYYKCHTAQHNNISAIKSHAQLEKIFYHISLPDFMVEEIKETSAKELSLVTKDNKKQLLRVRTELLQCEEDLHSIENKWIQNQLHFETYSRCFDDAVRRRSALTSQIEILSKSEDEIYILLRENLEALTDMQYVYVHSNTEQKQVLVRKVFDNRLYYQNKIYRTPYMMDIFHHNLLILKQEQLLELDEKKGFPEEILTGGAAGSRTLVQTYSP